MDLDAPGASIGDGGSIDREPAMETSQAGHSSEYLQSRSNHIDEADEQSQIIVHIGSTRQEFGLNNDAAMRHSHYLRHVLSHTDEQQTLVLPEVQVESFQLFADFLTDGEIRTTRTHNRAMFTDRRWRYHHDDEWVLLADAWLLGDALASTTFKDAIVDEVAFKVKQDRKVPMGMYRLLWRPEISRTCGIKRLLMDLAVACWNEEDRWMKYSEGAEDVGVQEFFSELIEMQADVELWRQCVSSIDMLLFDVGCQYHDHYEEWTECYRVYWPDM